jgi:hypothetical protein
MAKQAFSRLSESARWVKSHPYTVVGAVALSVLGLCLALRQQSEWRDVYLPASARLWHGQDMYRPEDAYLYPPFMAWAALPFLALSDQVGRVVWTVANLACLIGTLRGAWRLSGGGRLEGSGAPWREHRAALLGCGCGVFYLSNCLAHQQTDVLIGALLTAGCLLLIRGKDLLAATALGLAAACKCTGLLWAPYLLWRGRPGPAVWLVTVAVSVNFLPDLVSRPPSSRSWVLTYTTRFLLPLTAPEHYVGSWGSDPAYNQSLSGMGQRWCLTSWTWSANDCTIEPRTPVLRPQQLRAILYGVQFLLLSVVLWVCGRPLRSIADGGSGGRQSLELGIVILLMLLLSPMSSKAHFGTLVIPGCCLARAALVSRSRLLGSLLLLSVFLGLLSNKDPLGERLYTLSLWYGVVTWQTLILIAGCLLAIRGFAARDTGGLPCPSSLADASGRAA